MNDGAMGGPGSAQFTIYDGHGCPTRLAFERQAKIVGRVEPEVACELIDAVLAS